MGQVSAEPGTLRREIGFAGSAFLSFNGMVGAGIFALPATLHTQFGAFSPWLFPIFGLLALIVAAPFVRLAALFPGTGGPVAYTAGFGPIVSFQVGWLYYVARVAALAANATVFATYLAALWPAASGPLGRAVAIAGLIGAITWTNMVGVRRAIRLLDGLTLLKALPLAVLALWGLASADRLSAAGAWPALDGIETAALLVFYAFIGFENLLVPAGETDRPERTIPRALIATIAGTAVSYFLLQLAYVSVMPADAAPEAPLAAMAQSLVGPAGAILITAAALCSIAGNITSSVTSTPRVTFALAEQQALPAWFGRVHPRWATPANSVLFMGGTGLLLALTGSFVWLAVVSTLARMIVYAASIAALPKAERQAGGRASLLLMLPALAVCLWAALQSDGRSWITLAVLLAVGALLSIAARWRR